VWSYILEGGRSFTQDMDPLIPSPRLRRYNSMYALLTHPDMQEHLQSQQTQAHLGLGSIFIYATVPMARDQVLARPTPLSRPPNPSPENQDPHSASGGEYSISEIIDEPYSPRSSLGLVPSLAQSQLSHSSFYNTYQSESSASFTEVNEYGSTVYPGSSSTALNEGPVCRFVSCTNTRCTLHRMVENDHSESEHSIGQDSSASSSSVITPDSIPNTPPPSYSQESVTEVTSTIIYTEDEVLYGRPNVLRSSGFGGAL
jgi:hypothetical protein